MVEKGIYICGGYTSGVRAGIANSNFAKVVKVYGHELGHKLGAYHDQDAVNCNGDN